MQTDKILTMHGQQDEAPRGHLGGQRPHGAEHERAAAHGERGLAVREEREALLLEVLEVVVRPRAAARDGAARYGLHRQVPPNG